MNLTLKFKITDIHPRHPLVRWYTVDDHCVHVMLDNGRIVWINMPRPDMYDSKQYLEMIATKLRRQLPKHLGFLSEYRTLLKPSEWYLTEHLAHIKAYEWCGKEGSMDVGI